jgi:hypothetical protein
MAPGLSPKHCRVSTKSWLLTTARPTTPQQLPKVLSPCASHPKAKLLSDAQDQKLGFILLHGPHSFIARPKYPHQLLTRLIQLKQRKSSPATAGLFHLSRWPAPEVRTYAFYIEDFAHF